ncbi:MAG: hypothetical protein P1U40_11210 [Coxiellaceae bacterium]|nr:hypothetical protein [Coxiellaceae bacterium]
MRLILMEAGSETIIVNADSGEYFFVDKNAWDKFHRETLDVADWKGGHAFTLPAPGETYRDNMANPPADYVVGKQIMPEELLARFIDPEKNLGAMIAIRNNEESALKIFDKRRYKRLVDCWSSQP